MPYKDKEKEREYKREYNREYYKASSEEQREKWRQYEREKYKANPEKERERNRERHRANPEKSRARHLKRNYGIGIEVYNTLIDGQGFCCFICNAPDFADGKPLFVDHDHKTGWVRGLLCDSCNNGLGRFADDPERLSKAAEYLRFHNREGQLPVKPLHGKG